MDVCACFTLIGEGGSVCIQQDSSGVRQGDSLGRLWPFQLQQSVGRSARWPPNPPFFLPNNRTQKFLPAEEAHVRPLDMRAGYNFHRLGGSNCAYNKKKDL